MSQINYKCFNCNGKGHIERWADKRFKNNLINKVNIFFRQKSCDSCIGTGINLHKIANSILFKGGW